MRLSKNDIMLYRFFCAVFLDHADIDRKTISYPKAKGILGLYAIPKVLRGVLLNEMNQRGYIKFQKNREGILITGKPIGVTTARVIVDIEEYKGEKLKKIENGIAYRKI